MRSRIDPCSRLAFVRNPKQVTLLEPSATRGAHDLTTRQRIARLSRGTRMTTDQRRGVYPSSSTKLQGRDELDRKGARELFPLHNTHTTPHIA